MRVLRSCSLTNSDVPWVDLLPCRFQWHHLPSELPSCCWTITLVISFFMRKVYSTQRQMGNDISSQLGAYESSVWTAVGTIVGENFALWKTTLRSRHGHTAFRTKARLLGWLSACSLVGQTLGHITSPSASSGSSPATPLPPGCWVLLYLRQAVHGFIGYKSLFSPAHQKKKRKRHNFLEGVYWRTEYIVCYWLVFFLFILFPPKMKEGQHSMPGSHAWITACWCSFGFHKE